MANSIQQRSAGSTAHSPRRRRDPHSCFCTIRRSTRASCTPTQCGCGTRMRSRHSSKAIRACCWSRRGMFIAPRKPSSRASLPPSARPANRRSRLNSNRAGRKFSEIEPPAFHLHAWLPGERFGSVVTHVVPVGEFPGPYSYGYADTTPPPPISACFYGQSAALSSVTFNAYIPSAGATRLWR